MSEGYPEGQEQQFPTLDNEQSVNQPQREGEDVQVTEPTAVEENGGTDTRWDHDKAETMAAVLKADGTFDKQIDSREGVKQEVDSKEYLDHNTEEEGDRLRMMQERASEPMDERSSYSTTQAERETYLDEAQKEYNTAVAKTHDLGEEAIERSRQRVENKVDEVLSPYRELYDMNPAAFAEMPTKEFMIVASELAEINGEIENNEDNSKKIEWWNHQIKNAFEEKHIVNYNIIDALEKAISDSLGMDDNTYDEMLKKFEAETSDWFDKTPRQIMEGYMRVSGEYTSQFEAKQLADQQRKQDFLDKYKPETSDQDQN